MARPLGYIAGYGVGAMERSWQEEFEAVATFTRDLEARPTLSEALPEDLSDHAVQVTHLQTLLSLIAALPPASRPPVQVWDELLGPLWRRLFAKGDDVTRYILADLWRGVLLEAGDTEGFYRATTAVVASARNFYRFDEAAALCREAHEVSAGKPSAALANLVNTEGFVFLCQGDFDAAEASYRQALAMAEALPEEDVVAWTGLSKTDFRAQELLNLLDACFKRGYGALGADRAGFSETARQIFAQLSVMPCSEGFQHYIETQRGELFMLEGRLKEARAIFRAKIERAHQEGPYRLSLAVMDGRLLSVACSLDGDWAGAYHWIRWAMKTGTAHSYPSEDQLVLEQAVRVLRGLHESRDLSSEEQLVQELSLLLEDKDWYTGRSHSRNVGRLALRLGENLKETQGWDLDLDLLGRAGLLHDIGKLRVPWSLLNKIAPITPKEWSLLKDHSLHGADLLSKMGMGPVGMIVLQHHETLDGSGYPNGRVPDRMASIVAVCDVYEATVTPNRRYKIPKMPRYALGELRQGAGRLYNPQVVEALAATLDAGVV